MPQDSKLSYIVPGMTCGHCKQAVEQEVARVPGVAALNVDLASGAVTVEGDDIDDAAVRAAIREAGYEIAA
jgi:copper chaperone